MVSRYRYRLQNPKPPTRRRPAFLISIDMDMTGQLPEDMLLDVLHRLSPRSLAASRCVRKEWRAAVDDHCLLRTDLLPLSLDGVFLELRDPDLPLERMEHPMPALFSRRTTARRIAASLGYPDTPCVFECGVQDCCNGLLLLCGHVVNPATLQWVELPTGPPRCCYLCMSSHYLVFDPTVSQHYEVFSVPDIPWNLPTGHISKHVCKDKPVSEMEWPPSPYIVDVFSSQTGEWKERSFVREGKAAGTVADCRSKGRCILCCLLAWSTLRLLRRRFCFEVCISADTLYVFGFFIFLLHKATTFQMF